MKKRTGMRCGAVLSATAVLMGTAAMGAGQASAAGWHWEYHNTPGLIVDTITVSGGPTGEGVGVAEWQPDPSGHSPGDALSASDTGKDGYGIEAHLSTGRVASTRGHGAPYRTTVTGNLPEHHTYAMWVCVVKGSSKTCSGKMSVNSSR